jgi:hypothetical protein
MKAASVWRERKFESLTREALRGTHDGDSLWSAYEHTREDILSHILPYIAAQEPGLSDHGSAHIANVIENVGQVLGLSSGGQGYPDAPIHEVKPFERLLLLLGALLHDIGNIVGRQRHNLVTEEVWRNSGQNSYGRWEPADRKSILALCQAHTGKAANGDDDTLRPLSTSHQYFLGDPVPLAKLAATLRFADELAEGSQRTSRFLLFQGLYGAANIDFHRYADSTHVTIDRAHGRIALDYHIDLSKPGFGTGDQSRDNLKRLLDLVFKRVLKLEKERVFARHYAPDWLAFSETSVVITVERDYKRVCELAPLVLNDFNLRDANVARLAHLDAGYDVENILARIFDKAEKHGDV